MAKSMITMEGIGLTIYPEFQMRDEFKRMAEKILWEMNSPTKLVRTAMIDLLQNRDMLVRMPSQINKVLDGLSRDGGDRVIEVESGIDTDYILAGALILSSSILLLEALPPRQMLLVGAGELAIAAYLLLR